MTRQSSGCGRDKFPTLNKYIVSIKCSGNLNIEIAHYSNCQVLKNGSMYCDLWSENQITKSPVFRGIKVSWIQGWDSPSLELCYHSLWLALLQWLGKPEEKTVIVEFF